MKKLISFAKSLRKRATDTENNLWYYLRAKRFQGLKFRRQHPVGPYIVDFVCLESRIIIELDGSQHVAEEEKDKKRDAWLRQEGYKVLRFWDNEFYQNREGILEKIAITCFGPPSP